VPGALPPKKMPEIYYLAILWCRATMVVPGNYASAKTEAVQCLGHLQTQALNVEILEEFNSVNTPHEFCMNVCVKYA